MKSTSSNNQQDLYTLFYDGACPLCQKEVNWLKKRCQKRGYALGFVDISAADFDARPTGKTLSELMKELHLRDPRGEWSVAMEATRKIYQQIGLGWLMKPTGWPVLRPLFDHLYSGFARIRPRLQKEPCDRCIR